MKYVFLLSLTFILHSAYTQSTWRKGTITTVDGTELKGEINDQEWTVNPKEVEFREVGGAIKTYTAHQLTNFSTDRPSRYESFSIEYDGENQNVNRLTTNRNPTELTRDTLFLKVIVKAKVALFHFVDSNGRVHFFISKDNRVEELLYRKYKDPENTTLYGANEKFKQQLLLTATTCTELHASIKQLKYTEEVLRKIVNKINTCQGNPLLPLWEGVTSKKPASIGVVVQLFFSNPEYTFLVSDFSKLNYGGGVFYEIYNKKRPNRISLYNELLFKQVNQEGLFFANQTADLKFSRIKMINSYRFSYPDKNKGRLYWGIGLGTGVRFNTLINDKESIPGYPVYNDPEFEIGFMVSAGKTFPLSESFKINAELRYELEQSPFGSSSFVGAHNIGLNIGFNFR